MAELPIEITTTVLELQKQLLSIIHKTTATAFTLLESYGETEKTIVSLNDLDNIRERANTYYSRFYTLLLRIADSQPIASNAMLELLDRSIDEAQANIAASEATIREEKRNWNLP
ncbi:conserved hypothetical protein [Rippkaea orientalis PCC 8801]|uniref:Uncharacterized protein n=1 Tax=Rippkaea orientalis (strain PCC 8801 / RF-1) TaxID=41431 RepID=B7JVB0_RIPO1|nr:hypothetical protein [Rippkaea orientalis]ACK68243.1 conserved hypothetical protein [Rippkaea orientalis PCC 8801]